jgi:LuxR family maltose regulon positive regulatory protein
MTGLVNQKAPWLARTKFYFPQIRGGIIPRDRLTGWLAKSAAAMPITLISAPAGYGKTTLLATLQTPGRGQDRLNKWPIAWLSLDEEEDDLNAFLLALIGALQTLEPRCGTATWELLPLLINPDSPQNGRAEVRRLMGTLINELTDSFSAPFLLVIDDLHFITNPLTLAALDFLLERLPPLMHIVLATRRDPPLSLPRYRARRRLAELRLTDLRFTAAETANLLNGVLDLNVTLQEVETLQARTEGWAAGLSLLANSLERMPSGERAPFIAHLAQTHQETFDYLSEEVLRRQPPALQTFLLQTSILHTLTPEQCTAVTGKPDAETILEDLYRRNVFILAVDSESGAGRSYRYHALFADFLRHRLIRELPEQVPELHRRAASSEISAGRAIDHFAAAGMWDEAAAVINKVGLENMRQGRLDLLSGWINQLPESTRLAHPRLAYLMGLCELQKGDAAAAEKWLEEALTQAQKTEDTAIQGAALVAMGSVSFVQLRFAQTLDSVSRALSYPVAPYVRVQALMARASVALFSGTWDQAAADLEETLVLVENRTGDQEALLALMLFLGQEFTLLPGKLARIEAFCARVQEGLGEASADDGKRGDHEGTPLRGLRPVRLGLEDVMAFIHLRRGRLSEAIAAGERAIQLKEQLGGYYPFLGLNAAITVATAQAALGDYEAAERYLALMETGVSALPLNRHTAANGLYPQARTDWLQGQTEGLRAVHAQMCALGAGEESPQARVLRLVVQSLMHIAQGEYETAMERLSQAEALAELAPLASIYVCPPIIRAYALQRMGDREVALDLFAPVLASCEEAGTLGVILQEGQTAVALLELAVEKGIHADYAGRLLSILGAVREPPLYEPPLPDDAASLTERELEVLRLLAAGASNKDIAEALVISMATVKSHVSHILSKLNVSSRGQAAARARELDL